MIRSQYIWSILLIFTIVHICVGQSAEFSGMVKDIENKKGLRDVEIFVNAETILITDGTGKFSISREIETPYRLIFFNKNYEILDTIVTDRVRGLSEFFLTPLTVSLSTLEISAFKESLFGIRQLRDIEGTTINAGKKTEVVEINKIMANLATNNSRQVFAQIGGLNIYEGSDGGLQLNVGGRGLDPSRTANFNTRQNGYDISADVLGYPESYYTPPTNAITEIQIIRGASSLQYGTQFGGLVNFVLHKIPSSKRIGIKTVQTLGSYGLYDSYNQIGVNVGKISLNTFYNYKKGNGYRSNSNFDVNNLYASLEYRISEKAILTGEFTYFRYLAQQAGGLTDYQFEVNPRQSTRQRNWFGIDWKLYNVKYQHFFTPNTRVSLSLFGLNASRQALGFRGNPINLNENPITALDERDVNGTYINPRDLILGTFKNYGAELRFLSEYQFINKNSVGLIGLKWYDADNSSIQGPGSNGTDANFSLFSDSFPDYPNQSEFNFPNKNLAFFAENILYLQENLSITPGMRIEYINTGSVGSYSNVLFDNAGNPILNEELFEDRELKRTFALFGIGIDYKIDKRLNIYANLSQNYRSVTFSDIRIVSPSFIISSDISDEKGYTSDVGVRGKWADRFSYNVGIFGVLYQDRIGIIFDNRANRVRKNIGDALIGGMEALINVDFTRWIISSPKIKLTSFLNFSMTKSEYLTSENQNVEGNKVEFVPEVNLKWGLNAKYQNLSTSFQFSYLSKQYTDAQNSAIAQQGDLRSGIIGEIPSYSILDLAVKYNVSKFQFNAGVNNLLDRNYFTRRATGYPGPGIIPSDGRNWYIGIIIQN